jgi:hypothetical protein
MITEQTLELVYSRWGEEAIRKLVDDDDFTDNTIEVDMSSGSEYENLRLTVTEFRPRNKDILALNFVGPKDTNSQCQMYIPSYSPPLGLYRTSAKELKKKCLAHIESIIETERDIDEVTEGDVSIISWKIFEAVNNYRKSNGDNSDVSNRFSIYPD